VELRFLLQSVSPQHPQDNHIHALPRPDALVDPGNK